MIISQLKNYISDKDGSIEIMIFDPVTERYKKMNSVTIGVIDRSHPDPESQPKYLLIS